MSISRILKWTYSRVVGQLLFGSPSGFSGLGIATTSALLQILWNFELVHARSEEVTKPRFESRPGFEYKLREDGIQFRRLSCLQASEGSSKLLRPKGSEILWPSGVGIFHRSDSCLLTSLIASRPPSSVPCPSRAARRWRLPRQGTGERSTYACSNVDGSPRLAARVWEVDGINSFLPSLCFCPSRDGRTKRL